MILAMEVFAYAGAVLLTHCSHHFNPWGSAGRKEPSW
jgi:hypothetical protein